LAFNSRVGRGSLAHCLSGSALTAATTVSTVTRLNSVKLQHDRTGTKHGGGAVAVAEELTHLILIYLGCAVPMLLLRYSVLTSNTIQVACNKAEMRAIILVVLVISNVLAFFGFFYFLDTLSFS